MNQIQKKIFISYSHSDQNYVDEFIKILSKSNLSVWTDESLMVGSDWAIETENALQQSNAIVVLLSPDSLKSEWVNYEIGYAISAAKKIIPILIRDVDIPGLLKSYQYIDARRISHELAGRKLVESLNKINK